MKKNGLNTLRTLLILTAFLLVGMALAFYFRPQPVDQRIALGESLGGEFTLQTSEGSLKLSDLAGKAVVFYLGYTNCPDVCPTGLAVLSQAIHTLTPEEQAQVRGVFLSVDPERDSVDALKEYAAFFHPNIIGATGSREEIDRVVKRYGAFYRIGEETDSASGYAVDHSSRLYLINQEGILVSTLMHSSTPAEVAAGLKSILNQG
ncbi:SCO family protein [Pontibacterium sp.]|jgi:protein SCO1/2|uniref:SCO family protein n=1 Tax=Pontibacterium sp. TaxID=2036026 RepID=UPI00356A725A|nr:SCO family protein [Oceanospirillaceae bacterium]